MPTISMFYGILIRMFFRDTEKHHEPHIHADYQGQVAVYSISEGILLAGSAAEQAQTGRCMDRDSSGRFTG